MKEKESVENQISEDKWKIVEERLSTMPEKMRLGILSKTYTKEELLEEVKNKTEVGKAYVDMQMEFVRWLAKQSKTFAF